MENNVRLFDFNHRVIRAIMSLCNLKQSVLCKVLYNQFWVKTIKGDFRNRRLSIILSYKMHWLTQVATKSFIVQMAYTRHSKFIDRYHQKCISIFITFKENKSDLLSFFGLSSVSSPTYHPLLLLHKRVWLKNI